MSRIIRLLTWAAVFSLFPNVVVGGDPPKTDLVGDPLPKRALVRLGTIRLRHSSRILHLAFSPDGNALAAASCDNLSFLDTGWSAQSGGSLRLWNPKTGKELRPVEGTKGNTNSLAFSDKFLVTVCDRGPVRIWDPANGKAIAAPEELATGIYQVALTPDSKTLAAASLGMVRLIDPTSGKEVRRFELPEMRLIPLISPEGTTLAAAFWEPRGKTGVCLWDIASGRELHRLPAEAYQFGMAFSRDGKTLATGSGRQPVRLWDIATGKENAVLGDTSVGATFVAFLPDAKELLVCTARGAFVYDVATKKELRHIDMNWQPILARALSPDGKTLAVSEGNAIRLFDTGKELFPSSAPVNEIETVAFSPDGKTVLTGGAGLRLWEAATAKELASLGDASPVGAAVFTPDGKTVIAGYTREETVLLWDVASTRMLRRVEGEPGQVEYLGFLSDGLSFVSMCRVRTVKGPISAVQERGISLRTWNPATGKETGGVSKESMFRATCSADGRRLVGGMQQLGIWDTQTGKELARVAPPRVGAHVLALALTPEGRRLAISYSVFGHREIQISEVATGSVLSRLTGHDGLTLVLAIAPDGRTLASGGSDGTVRLWDLDTGKELAILTGHRESVLSLAFSADGRRLLSGSNDTTALLWDVADLLPLPGATRLKVEELQELWLTLATSDGSLALRAVRRLAADPDQTVPLFRAQMGKPLALDPKRLARLLDDLEAEEFEKREAASAELARLGPLAEAALKRALENKPSPEMRWRAEELLKKLDPRQLSPGELQALRAVEVLELIGTPPARALLQSSAKDAISPRVTAEAKAALDRLAGRKRER